MIRVTSVFVLSIALAGCATSAPEPAPERAPEPVPVAVAKPSPRHQEWADVTRDARTVRCFVVYPEAARPVPAIIVIHENKGLTDWVRSVADRLAAEGFVAIAPDMLSGAAPGGGGTEGFPTADAATAGISKLPPAQVTDDLAAVTDYVKKLPGCNGTAVVGGFCWGGSQTFRFATNRSDLAAAYVFYGSAPDDEAALVRIACPVYGFYAENDARISATLPATEERMQRTGKTFEKVIYADAGHAFMRSGEEPTADQANCGARDAAWARWLGLLRRL